MDNLKSKIYKDFCDEVYNKILIEFYSKLIEEKINEMVDIGEIIYGNEIRAGVKSFSEYCREESKLIRMKEKFERAYFNEGK